MLKNFKIKYLSKKHKPYFVSEIGINHNGRLQLALEMIRKSKNSGFDAVKFQKRDAKKIHRRRICFSNLITYQSGIAKENSRRRIIFETQNMKRK